MMLGLRTLTTYDSIRSSRRVHTSGTTTDVEQSEFIAQAATERDQQRRRNEDDDSEGSLHHRRPADPHTLRQDSSYSSPERAMDTNELLQDLTTSTAEHDKGGGFPDVQEGLADIMLFTEGLRPVQSASASLPDSLSRHEAVTPGLVRSASDPGCRTGERRRRSSICLPSARQATSEPAPSRPGRDEVHSKTQSRELTMGYDAESEAWSIKPERSKPPSPSDC